MRKAGLVPVKIKVSKRTWLLINFFVILNPLKMPKCIIFLLLGGVIVAGLEVLVDKVVQFRVIE